MELSWEIDDEHPRMHIKRMDGACCRIKGDIIPLQSVFMRRGRGGNSCDILPFMSGQEHLNINIFMMQFKAALSFALTATAFAFRKNFISLDWVGTRFDCFRIDGF